MRSMSDKFADNILKGNMREQQIAASYRDWYKKEYSKPLIVKHLGCNLEFRADSRPDFLFNNVPVEVKSNAFYSDKLAVKSRNLQIYADFNSYLLWVKGYQLDTPMFALLPPQELKKKLTEKKVFVRHMKQSCHIFHAADYEWTPFSLINDPRVPAKLSLELPSGNYDLVYKNDLSLRFHIDGQLCYASVNPGFKIVNGYINAESKKNYPKHITLMINGIKKTFWFNDLLQHLLKTRDIQITSQLCDALFDIGHYHF
jgi:hypothetical protein